MRKTAIAAALMLAGCVTESGLTPSQEADHWALANARAVGEPQDCLTLNRIRASDVLDDRTIDFTMVDGKVMRSRLSHSCPGLGFEERFSYRTSIGRLCSVDIITVHLPDGSRGASCGLGPFQEVEIAERPR